MRYLYEQEGSPALSVLRQQSLRLRRAVKESECGTPEEEQLITIYYYESAGVDGPNWQSLLEETVAFIIGDSDPDRFDTPRAISLPDPIAVPWVVYKPGPI